MFRRRLAAAICDAVPGSPRAGSGHGLQGPPRAVLQGLRGSPLAGAGLLLHGLPRAGAGVLLHGPPRAGAGVFHGLSAPTRAGSGVIYSNKALGGSPSASLTYDFLNGARGCSRAESAGAAALFTPRGRGIHNGRLMTSSGMLIKRSFRTKRSFSNKRSYSTENSGKKSTENSGKKSTENSGKTARVQAIWFAFFEFLKTAPTTVLKMIKNAQGPVLSILQSLKRLPATVKAHWLYIIISSLYSFAVKCVKLFDRYYKREVAYFPLFVGVTAAVYLDLSSPLEYIHFLNYICEEKAGKLVAGYERYCERAWERALENAQSLPVQDGPLAVEQARRRLKQAEEAFEATWKKAVSAVAEEAAAKLSLEQAQRRLKYIDGGHVANYIKALSNEGPEKYQSHFSEYIKRGLSAEDMEAIYKKVHAVLCADPTRAKSTKGGSEDPQKGALDGGLDIPHSDKRIAGFKKDEKQLDAGKYIDGGHVANYIKALADEEPAKYQSHFIEYIKRGFSAEDMEAIYKEVHAGFCAYPTRAKSTKGGSEDPQAVQP